MRALKFIALGAASAQLAIELFDPQPARVPAALFLLTFALMLHWAGRPGASS